MLFDDTLATVVGKSRRFGDRPALICGDTRVSYIELDDRVGRLAAALRSEGLGPGTVASIYGPVGCEWVIAYHAVLRIGAIVNPINALLTPDEVGFLISDCAARFVVGDAERLERLQGAGQLPATTRAISFETIDALSTNREPLGAIAQLDAKQLSTLCYTSGTTGRPKGAMLSHRNVLLNSGLTALMHGRCERDVIVSGLPLAHVYGNVVMNGALLVGATLVLLPAFSAEAALASIEAHSGTVFDGVPTMYYRMLDHSALTSADLSSLRICTVGGQTMPVEKMQSVETRFGCPLIELWGMSEIGGLGTTFPSTGPRKLGSIGVPLPSVSTRVVDLLTGDELGIGEPGELQIRGPIVMDGYLHNEEATAEVLDADGWLSTGDVVQKDADGFIHVVDRSKDVILTSGNNVYPAEIERVIASLSGISMVGVGRDAHPEKGEVPHAYVVLEQGVNLTPDAVIEHCRLFLAPYKIPRSVTQVDKLPLTSSGKIMRRHLKQSQID